MLTQSTRSYRPPTWLAPSPVAARAAIGPLPSPRSRSTSVRRGLAAVFALGLVVGCAAEPAPAPESAVDTLAAELSGLATIDGRWAELGYSLWEMPLATPARPVTEDYCLWVRRAAERTCASMVDKGASCSAEVTFLVSRAGPVCDVRLLLTDALQPTIPTILHLALRGSAADVPQCGDGSVDPGEACDDANVLSGDGCSATCGAEICGNGVLDPGEGCDDGNLLGADGCTLACAIEACGNGVLDPGEVCDDQNDVSGDGCSAACAVEICGNGVVDAGESCDDGNLEIGDACGATCVWEYCGNGILDPGEECDSEPGCTWSCGDGQCEDGGDGDGLAVIAGLGCQLPWMDAPSPEGPDAIELPFCDPDCLGEGFYGECETVIEEAFRARGVGAVDAVGWDRSRAHLMVHESASPDAPPSAETCAAASRAAEDSCAGIVDAMMEAVGCTATARLHEEGGAPVCTVRWEIEFGLSNPRLGVYTPMLDGILQLTLR